MFANALIEHGLVRNLASEVPGLSGSDLKRFPVAYGLLAKKSLYQLGASNFLQDCLLNTGIGPELKSKGFRCSPTA